MGDEFMDNGFDSSFGKLILISGLISTAFVIGITGYSDNKTIKNPSPSNFQRLYEMKSQDLNNNGLPERFYELPGGKKAFLEIDGKTIESMLKE